MEVMVALYSRLALNFFSDGWPFKYTRKQDELLLYTFIILMSVRRTAFFRSEIFVTGTQIIEHTMIDHY